MHLTGVQWDGGMVVGFLSNFCPIWHYIGMGCEV